MLQVVIGRQAYNEGLIILRTRRINPNVSEASVKSTEEP